MINKLFRNHFVVILILIIISAFIAGHTGRNIAARVAWQQKVDTVLLEDIADGSETEFLVVLQEQADLSLVETMVTKAEKGAYVYEQLTAVALRTQPEIIAILKQYGAPYRQYWVNNMIWVKGDAQLLQLIASQADVAKIHANPEVALDTIGPIRRDAENDNESFVEWNIELINAPDVWAQGVNGDGVVIGGQDTGYQWDHPALIDKYRGWDGSTANHDYNWYDAIHAESGLSRMNANCEPDSPEPCDDNGHGTHTMGTMVGEEPNGNGIGMAPGAKWIACRNMKNGVGTPATYSECYQWFIAPYPSGGDPLIDGDPSKAPHVINNSWSCPTYEGCIDPNILKSVVENVRAAGIVTVHAASNGGPLCSTIDSPAAIYDASYTVGATNSDDVIAGFSSRGPVTKGDNNPAKPDISAPGVSIRSSRPVDGYGYSSGTSMAAPHVAGLVALLIDARPDLAGDVDLLEQFINETAMRLFSTQDCGDDDVDTIPNHVYGWGRIDALQAYQAVVDGIEPGKILYYTPTWLVP